jgi:hypothetical protein
MLLHLLRLRVWPSEPFSCSTLHAQPHNRAVCYIYQRGSAHLLPQTFISLRSIYQDYVFFCSLCKTEWPFFSMFTEWLDTRASSIDHYWLPPLQTAYFLWLRQKQSQCCPWMSPQGCLLMCNTGTNCSRGYRFKTFHNMIEISSRYLCCVLHWMERRLSVIPVP